MDKARFRVAQKAFIKNKKNKYLVLRFSHSPSIPEALQGKWDFPGGGLEDEELLESGLLREFKEELGDVSKIKIGDPIVTWSFIAEKDSLPCIAIGYAAQWIEGEIVLSDEHEEYVWLSATEVLKLDWEHSSLKNKLKSIFTKLESV